MKRESGAAATFALAALACLPVLGCDALLLDREPEVAHLEVTSGDVAEVVLVTSQWFVRVADTNCVAGGCPAVIQLVEADTSVVALPFAKSYPFTSRLQFFAELYPDASTSATVAMKVNLDDDEWYDDSRQLPPVGEDGERPTLRFVYEYHVARSPGN